MIYILSGDYEEARYCAFLNGLSTNQWKFAFDMPFGARGELWKYGDYGVNPYFYEIRHIILENKLPEVNKNQ